MIKPKNIIKYGRNRAELEELIVFCVLVAGKTATTTSKRLNNFVRQERKIWNKNKNKERPSVFKLIRMCEQKVYEKEYGKFADRLKSYGFGCYNQKAETLSKLVRAKLKLEECTLEELEEIPGIGRKTSRFFLMSSRPNVQVAALDTHLLKWLKFKGVKGVPPATPSSEKTYRRLEGEFLKRVPKNKTVAEFDFEIWKRYSKYLESVD